MHLQFAESADAFGRVDAKVILQYDYFKNGARYIRRHQAVLRDLRPHGQPVRPCGGAGCSAPR